MIYFIDRYDFKKDLTVKEYSGYEQIVKYSIRFKRVKSSMFLNKVLAFLFKKYIPSNYIKYNLSKEIIALYYSLFFGAPIIYLYADKDAFLLPLIKRKLGIKKIKIFGTLHWPVEISSKYSFYYYQLENQFNGLISLSDSISKQFPQCKKIPHGIDLFFWYNMNINNYENYYLIIGESNRDHQKQIDIIIKIAEIDKDAQFKIIISNSKYRNLYQNLNNTELINKRITDYELRHLYSKAKAVVLFQHYCLASNVVLESISMGVPLIANNVGDISEYVGEEYEMFIDNSQLDSDKLKFFVENKSFRNSISESFTQKRSQFEWAAIATNTIQFIENS